AASLDDNHRKKNEVVRPDNLMENNLILFQSAVIIDSSPNTPIKDVRSGGSIKDRLKFFEKFHSGGN
ncbi:MAG: hypothetical protein WD512_00255, partial [Candidatus Paceibacterota bacterium]